MNKYIGTAVNRIDAPDKAIGLAKYAADYYMEDMLHIAIVRSSIAHGEILSIDTSEISDDVYVFTAKDFASIIMPSIISDQPALAFEKVRYLGEPVAIVAAKSLQQAKEQVQKVKVTYKPLEYIGDPEQAINGMCELIHQSGNLLGDFKNRKGNAEAAFLNCDLVLEDTFYLPTQDHAYLEPEASFAYINEEGVLILYASTQNVFTDKEMVCTCLGLEQDKVQVIAATIGGGFGGKDGNTTQIFSALVTQKTGLPSKTVFTREESLCTTFKRHAAKIHIKMGLSNEGLIKAFDGTIHLDTGAYAVLGPAVLSHSSEHLAGPYNIENVNITSYLCYTNKPSSSAMRGFGAPQGAFATESLLNRAAKILNIDPIDIRLMNALENGSLGALGQKMEHEVGFKQTLQHLKESEFWKQRTLNTDEHVGYGLAAGHMSCGMGRAIPDTAKVEIQKINEEYIVKAGLVDLGQGSSTALAMFAADELKVDISNVKVIMADTNATHDCGSTAASRSCFILGNAIIDAVKDLNSKIARGEEPIGIGFAKFPESSHVLKNPGLPHAIYSFFVHAVKVRVNPHTGMVTLLDSFGVTEAGKVINPITFAGQIHGGMVMSAGYALSEVCEYKDNGALLQKDFSTYILPTALDVPNITSETIETYEPSGPYGIKGMAEAATVAFAPAIASAVTEVIDENINKLPISPEQIIIALSHKQLQ